jgi:hypothetical protein
MPSSLASFLNRNCVCQSLAPERLPTETQRYFSAVPVYIARAELEQMAAMVAAIERLVRSEAYRARVLSWSAELERAAQSSLGVCMGYDFHLSEQGPQLIEVNTNAGGAMLGAVLSQAQRVTCEHAAGRVRSATDVEGLAARYVDMFRNEWRLARGSAPLRRLAIVDDEPEQQFLHREFQLFQELFRSSGYDCVIADPSQLVYREGVLSCGGEPMELVYNRLVDFGLNEPRHAALRRAYLDSAVVVTPHPHAYALYADKRNLIELGRPELWEAARLSAQERDALARGIPETRLVTNELADEFWRDRKTWFFKPVQGYGSKAAYRGDKLTRATFSEILTRDYVAQRIVVPGERWVDIDGILSPLKYDVRCFVYDGVIQLVVARLYRGQTTNFRTPGGGFSPVFTAVGNDEPPFAASDSKSS